MVKLIGMNITKDNVEEFKKVLSNGLKKEDLKKFIKDHHNDLYELDEDECSKCGEADDECTCQQEDECTCQQEDDCDNDCDVSYDEYRLNNTYKGNKKELIYIMQTINNMFNTIVKKNSDYAGSKGFFDNFLMVDRLDIATVEQGFLTRMSDKFSRICNLLKPGATNKVTDESIEDTLLDFANYCILLNTYLKFNKRK